MGEDKTRPATMADVEASAQLMRSELEAAKHELIEKMREMQAEIFAIVECSHEPS
jgi:hypothetical protein